MPDCTSGDSTSKAPCFFFLKGHYNFHVKRQNLGFVYLDNEAEELEVGVTRSLGRAAQVLCVQGTLGQAPPMIPDSLCCECEGGAQQALFPAPPCALPCPRSNPRR